MIVVFTKKYLKELYTEGKASEKKYRFQPQIVSRYIRVISLMQMVESVFDVENF